MNTFDQCWSTAIDLGEVMAFVNGMEDDNTNPPPQQQTDLNHLLEIGGMIQGVDDPHDQEAVGGGGRGNVNDHGFGDYDDGSGLDQLFHLPQVPVVPSDYIFKKSFIGTDEDTLDNLEINTPSHPPGAGGLQVYENFKYYNGIMNIDQKEGIKPGAKFLGGVGENQPNVTQVAGNYSITDTNMRYLNALSQTPPPPPQRGMQLSSAEFTPSSGGGLQVFSPDDVIKAVQSDQYSSASTTPTNHQMTPGPTGRTQQRRGRKSKTATPTDQQISSGRTPQRRGRKPKATTTTAGLAPIEPKKMKKYEMFDPLNPSQNDKDVKNAAQAKLNRDKQKQETAALKARVIVQDDKISVLETQVVALTEENRSLEIKVAILEKKVEDEERGKRSLSEELTRLTTVLITNAEHIATVQTLGNIQDTPVAFLEKDDDGGPTSLIHDAMLGGSGLTEEDFTPPPLSEEGNREFPGYSSSTF